VNQLGLPLKSAGESTKQCAGPLSPSLVANHVLLRSPRDNRYAAVEDGMLGDLEVQHRADHARRRNSKRGADVEHVPLEGTAVISADRSSDFVSLDDALKALAERAPRKAKVVELRFFGGLTVDEAAEVLHVSSITVMREWKSAKAWLYRELAGLTANGQLTLESRR